MKKNQTNPIVKEADDFDITDKNLLFNVLLFVILFTLLAVSFLIFRGMKKNSKYSNDIYAVETDLMDAEGTIGMAGLFIPEQWSMPPYLDKYGNFWKREFKQDLAK